MKYYTGFNGDQSKPLIQDPLGVSRNHESSRIQLLKISGDSELFLRQFVEPGQTLDHSIIPRYWTISLSEARQAKQLGLSLKEDFAGLALTPKGIAIRVMNKAIARAREVILQGDIRFNEDNRHVIPNFVFLAQGFPFEISHEGIIKAVAKSVGQPPVPLRNFRLAGMLTWVLGFETQPAETHFVVQIGASHHEVLLTPQELQNKMKSKGRAPKQPKSSKPKNALESGWLSAPSFPAVQSNQSVNEKKIQSLEDRVSSLETKQDHLANQQTALTQKVDNRFDEVSLQLQQVLKAVTGNPGHIPGRSREPTGDTPPPKLPRSA